MPLGIYSYLYCGITNFQNKEVCHCHWHVLKSTDGNFQSDRLMAATYGGDSGLWVLLFSIIIAPIAARVQLAETDGIL